METSQENSGGRRQSRDERRYRRFTAKYKHHGSSMIDPVTADSSVRMNSEAYRAEPTGWSFTLQMNNDPERSAKPLKTF